MMWRPTDIGLKMKSLTNEYILGKMKKREYP
ncbi:unnamed protein product, partial [Didymodactylos carnosus]